MSSTWRVEFIALLAHSRDPEDFEEPAKSLFR
jgi:hypothetical protein